MPSNAASRRTWTGKLMMLAVTCAMASAAAALSAEDAQAYIETLDTSRKVANPTALDEYVARPDDTFSYELIDTADYSGVSGYIFHMKSQTWRSADEIDRTVWEHHVAVAVPDEVEHETAFLLRPQQR